MNHYLPAEDVRTEDTANDVAQMRDIVDIWQGTGHKNVFLALLWQTEYKLTEMFKCPSHNSPTVKGQHFELSS